MGKSCALKGGWWRLPTRRTSSRWQTPRTPTVPGARTTSTPFEQKIMTSQKTAPTSPPPGPPARGPAVPSGLRLTVDRLGSGCLSVLGWFSVEIRPGRPEPHIQIQLHLPGYLMFAMPGPVAIFSTQLTGNPVRYVLLRSNQHLCRPDTPKYSYSNSHALKPSPPKLRLACCPVVRDSSFVRFQAIIVE